MTLLRKASIPVAVFLFLAVNAGNQEQIHENIWVGLFGAALIVFAGALCVGKRWMYFVFPVGAAILLFLFNLARAYSQATDYFGHRPVGNELAAFLNTKWQSEYGAQGPYWLTIDIIFFVASGVGGWLYGTWSMLVPGAVNPPASIVAQPKQALIRKPFKIMLVILAAVILFAMIFGNF